LDNEVSPTREGNLLGVRFGKVARTAGTLKAGIKGPVIQRCHDLFKKPEDGKAPCTGRGFHKINTANTLQAKKQPY
jgi:hypothetical protein